MEEEHEKVAKRNLEDFINRIVEDINIEHAEFNKNKKWWQMRKYPANRRLIEKMSIAYPSGFTDGCLYMSKYKTAYYLLMEYWDSIADEEKPKLNEKLKELGL